MGTTPRSLQSLLHTATPDLADLLGRARFLARIRSALLEILPAQAAPHVRVAAYEHHQLRLHVDNAGWGTRLRYMQPAIVQALAQRMRLHIDRVDVRVRPPDHSIPSPLRARHISAANRGHLQRTAAHVDDPALAAALNRLARAGSDGASQG